jgi:hypothetical protein
MAELDMPSMAEMRAAYAEVIGTKFVKGPIPIDWLLRMDVTAHAAVVALIIKAMIDMNKQEPVSIPRWIWKQWGLAHPTRKRVLDALESAGIIRTERSTGHPTKI